MHDLRCAGPINSVELTAFWMSLRSPVRTSINPRGHHWPFEEVVSWRKEVHWPGSQSSISMV